MPETNKPIKGKIVSIVTHRNVVINRGAQDGVRKGMKFSVLLKVGRIEDPEDPTNTLESLSFVKAKITVSAVYDRMSYCATIGTLVGPFASLSLTSVQNPLLKEIPSYKYPPMGDKLMAPEDAWKLHRGDPVKQIVAQAEKER